MRKYSNLYSVLFLGFLAVIFFFPVIFLGKTFFLRDITYIFHPWKALCAEAIQRGEIPLWNPYAYCGMPLLANWQTAVFYPFSLLFYIFSFTSALKAFHFSQILLAGYFAYLFIRAESYNISAAMAVMVIFAFNGFVITKLEFLSYIGVISWTFALLLLRNNPLLLAVAICMSFMAGHQIFVFQILALLIYILFDLGGRSAALSVKNLLTAGAVSLGLTAIQLLPTLELIKHSYRNQAGIEYSIAMLHSLSFKSLAGLISPVFYKAKIDLVGGEYLQWDTTMYVGVAAMFASLTGIVAKPFGAKKTASFVLIILGVILALGNSTPIYPWLYRHLFIFHTMRYPVQYIYFSVIGLMLLAGEGINNIKFGYILTLLIALELLVTSINFQPLADNNYFSVKPASASTLQSIEPNGRFILSPGTEVDRHIAAGSIPGAWQGARGRLYNLTCLPYHLQNAFGFGEPLTGFAIETKVNELYKLPNAQAALSKYEELGVAYVLCKQPLSDSTGYKLAAQGDLLIYQLNSNPSIIEASAKTTSTEIIYSQSKNHKYLVNTDALQPDTIIFKECYFPGWELYLNGTRSQFNLTDFTFPKWNVLKGISKTYYIYRPISFVIGIFISILTLLGILIVSAKTILK